ncbi:MAG TPA: ribosome small subunit-dependent GTPase A [Nocardioidaceae bacterium]|nr:ribosome small subunit-dependent GTPase A [Nocardioidaceae bacterium]
MTSGYDVDDHERFDRPRRRTRPRTKQRPAHDDAVTGRVVTLNRGRYTLLVDDADGERTVTAMKARALGRGSIVVGDDVRIVGDISGADGSLARIVDVEPRESVLRRTADDDDPIERVIVANADQMVIVVALADPEPRPRLIDRCLVAAYDAGMDPLLCLTKADLKSSSEELAQYEPLGVPTVTTQQGGDLDPLRDALRDRTSVLVGHSGVGKSTLVNALIPGADRVTSEVNVVTGRGRHTSTSAYALRLPFGGWIVDTPGIRSFGLAHVDLGHVLSAFGDLAAATANCPRGCTHTAAEPECGLDEAVAAGQIDPRRVDSFRRLLASRDRRAGD